jgi:proline iminopeptidase
LKVKGDSLAIFKGKNMKTKMTIGLLICSLFSSLNLLAQESKSTLPAPYGQGNYIKTELGRIYYEADGEGTPIVMVNGGPGASRTVFWGALDFLKEKGFQIIYLDETGVGRATKKIEGKHTPLNTVEDLETLRKHLGVNKLVLAGHSYGGIPAVQYALKYPNHVEKLIMLSASADAISQQMNVNAAAYLRKTFFPQQWEHLEAMRAKGMLTSNKEYLRAFTTPDIGYASDWYKRQNRKGLRKFRSKDERDRFNTEVYFDIAGDDAEVEIGGTLKGLNVNADMFKSFTVPTLILNGRIDWKTTPEMAYRFYKMLPDGVGELVFLEKTGHWTWAEEPEKFVNIVSTFMEKQ